MEPNLEKTWRCSICGYLHYGDNPPETCPICEAQAEDFKEIEVAGVKPVFNRVTGLKDSWGK